MSYQYVCEACRQSMGLSAEASYHNRIKRERGEFGVSNLQLRDALATNLPEDVREEVYKSLKPDFKKLARFRDQKVAHSWPASGDSLTRIKREGGRWITYTITPEEVSEYLDLAVKLLSQLSFIPIYVDRANER